MKKLTFILSFLFAMTYGHAQVIEQTYQFNNPTVTEHEGYQILGFEGCLPMGQVGEPMLPWQNVSLILPQGQEATDISVEYYDFVELEGSYHLYPYQKPRPYSNDEAIPFAKNEDLYRSTTPYPSVIFSSVNTRYLNGVSFAFSGFTPIRYIPATGKVQVAQAVKVTIETTTSRDDHSSKLCLTPENTASIRRLAQNSDLLSSYNKRGRELGSYDMLIITAEEWIPYFDEYIALYNGKGVRTRIVSLEEIYASMGGRDEQEQIRNYIIQEYESNLISMVILGGDVAIVPYRSLFCWAQEGEEDQLPADMYYACLDGTLNDDNDELWGEVGEDDMLPEIGIGRLPFNNETQLQTIMHKTFSYLQNPVLGEFTSPILGGEHLGDGYYGSEDMERLVGTNSDFGYTTHGYTPNYTIKRYYETASHKWKSAEFKQVIGTGGQYVHHVGHANTGTVAGWDIMNMNNNYFSNNNGIDHNYMLFHSHGCICGDFSHACILEKMVTIPTGFVVTTGNSRYGWYEPWGDGMAAHIHREFVDAYCYDHIPSVGMALREAKIQTAPWVTIDGENGCLRWNIYCLNVLGDAALYPWFDEPFNPNVVFEQGLQNGTTTTQVHVSHFDSPLDNYQVSLFLGDTLLAHSVTDTNGIAELHFSPALSVNGPMQLIVTGQSAWPQILQVDHIANNEAFVYGNIIDLENDPITGSQSIGVSGDLFNKGNVAANSIHAAITSECEYINAHQTDFTIDMLDPNSNQHFEQLGLIDIADNIPDQTTFTLDLTTSVGGVTHTTSKSFLAIAPSLQFVNVTIDDSNGDGNGYADPGESFLIQVDGLNAGHALAHDTYLTISCDDERIQLQENNLTVGDIDSDGAFVCYFTVAADESIPSGTLVYFDITIHSGAYNVSNSYPVPVGLTKETFESGDFSYLSWNHSGSAPWFITDDEAHTGSYSARTGAIDDDEISGLIVRADIMIDGELSFYFKTSTQYHKDYLILYIDNKVKTYWSGENDWTYYSTDIPAGSHVIEWRYDKDPRLSAGSDCAWIDDIVLPRSSLVTGVEEVIVSQASIYPNPCDGSCYINLKEDSNITVFNMLGQKVMEMPHLSGVQQIQFEHAAKGLYLIQIQNKSGIEVKKLMVK